MRLITRSDFDGLACAVLLTDLGIVDDYLFVHPKDVQDGKVEVTSTDVLANVPLVAGCGMWFDHHASEGERLKAEGFTKFKGATRPAPSCARVIYDYFGGHKNFSHFDESGMMWAVDKSDAGRFREEEILKPSKWDLLSFIMDARTGLGRYQDYRISNLELMKDMIKYCRELSIDAILRQPDVKERVDRYYAQEKDYEKMLKDNIRIEKNVIVIDLKNVEEILSGNRFVEYAMYPEQNVSMRAILRRNKQTMVITVGRSIINRSCQTNIGSLMFKFGGGGHPQVGTCQIPVETADAAFEEILETLKKNG